MTTPSLFESRPRTDPPGLPVWLRAELRRLGVPRRVVAALHPREAYSRLYAIRRAKGGSSDPDREFRLAVAERVGAVLADPDPPDVRELTDLVTEAVSPLGADDLRRVVSGLIILLRETGHTVS